MKKHIVLLVLALCAGTMLWGQNSDDTVRIGESYYAYPDLSTSFYGLYGVAGHSSHEVATCDAGAYLYHYCWPYVPPTHGVEQAIYGIGVVVDDNCRDTGWGVALYMKTDGDTLECLAVQPVTQRTPHRHFLFSGYDRLPSIPVGDTGLGLDSSHVLHTVGKLYDVVFDYPRWAWGEDTVFFGIYDNYFTTSPYYTDPAVFGAAIVNASVTNKTRFDDTLVSDTTCGSPTIIRDDYSESRLYHGIFPIIAPPYMDAVPDDCAALAGGLSLVRQSGDTAVLQWGTIGAAYMSQLAWSKDFQGDDSLHRLSTTARSAMLTGLDTGWYACAVRAVCRHLCYFHDTLLYGAWSDTLLFYLPPRADTTGNDTTGMGGDTTAILLAEEAESLLLAPNPTDGQVTLSSPYPLRSLEVTDLQGRAMLQQQASGLASSFNVCRWSSGLYLVRARTVRGTFTARLIVQ